MNHALDQHLKQSPYFSGLSATGRATLAEACQRREVARRGYLFHEGQKGDALFLVESGELQLVKSSGDSQDVVIRSVRPGDVFGEVILFEKDMYPVSAVAVKKSSLYSLPRVALLGLLDDPDFRNEFIGGLMQRMRYLAERILYLTAYDAEERFYRFLEEMAGRQETYDLSLSKKDMASAIGTTPETLSRLLARLESAGDIQMTGKCLKLRDGFWERRG